MVYILLGGYPHVFPYNVPELFIGQLIFGRWVQRYMEYRITRALIGFEVRHKTLHAGIDIHASVSVEGLQHLLPKEYLGFTLIHFLLVIKAPPGEEPDLIFATTP